MNRAAATFITGEDRNSSPGMYTAAEYAAPMSAPAKYLSLFTVSPHTAAVQLSSR